MNDSQPSTRTRRDWFIAAGIFLASFLVFYWSPVNYIGDSRYSLLVSQSLVSKGSFALDGYGIPIGELHHFRHTMVDGDIYQLEVDGGHLYYLFPPGSSILDVPFLVVGRWFGESVLGPDGKYNLAGDEQIQQWIAPLLMAVLAAVFYGVGRLLLPAGWSAIVALGAAFGTQVWSTASRAVWSHTWSLILLSALIYLLLAQEMGQRKIHPVLLGTLLSWLYIVRPTNAIAIMAVTVYVLLFHRSQLIPLVLTGAAWLAGFVFYSWYHFGTLQPSYYERRLDGLAFWEALPGNLISPGRGLFIYVPVVLFVLYLLAAHRRSWSHPRLAWLALAVCVGQVLTVSCTTPWHGGWCFGPRLTTELVAWLVLLSWIGIDARLREGRNGAAARRPILWQATWTTGAALLLLSVFINGRGGAATATLWWNKYPFNVEKDPSAKVWDWSYPQLLAGLVPMPSAATKK